MTVGEFIKRGRIMRGLSQKELGNKLGLTESYISQYERGLRIPKISTINKICEALEIPTAEYIRYCWNEPNKNTVDDELQDMLRETFQKNHSKSQQDQNLSAPESNHGIEQMSELPDGYSDGEHLWREVYRCYRKLNMAGHRKVLSYVQDLTQIDYYRLNIENEDRKEK